MVCYGYREVHHQHLVMMWGYKGHCSSFLYSVLIGYLTSDFELCGTLVFRSNRVVLTVCFWGYQVRQINPSCRWGNVPFGSRVQIDVKMVPVNHGMTVVVKHFLIALCQLSSKALSFLSQALKKYSTPMISVCFQVL